MLSLFGDQEGWGLSPSVFQGSLGDVHVCNKKIFGYHRFLKKSHCLNVPFSYEAKRAEFSVK